MTQQEVEDVMEIMAANPPIPSDGNRTETGSMTGEGTMETERGTIRDERTPWSLWDPAMESLDIYLQLNSRCW